MTIGEKIKGFVLGKSFSGMLPGNLPTSLRWGASAYLNANDISLYTNRALTKRSEKVGEIQFVIKDSNDELVEENPLLDLLKHPNKRYTASKFWALYQTYLDLLGSVYIVKEVNTEPFATPFGETPKIESLHLLRPDLVTPKFDDRGNVTYYEYRTGGNTVRYEVAQIIYIFNPDPKNPLVGRSLLKSGIQAIQTEVQIGAYHSRVLENGGKVEGVFKFKTPRITKEQLQQLKDGYDEMYADARKSGKPLFLGGDADYVKTGLTPDELSYLEAKKVTLEDIVILTGVPKPILGALDDIQFSNADTAIRIFLRETIVPLLKGLTDALDQDMLPGDLTLSFVDPTPENVDEKLKVLAAAKDKGFITTNEGRQLLSQITGKELPDVDNGDVILVPFNLIELGATSTVEKTGSDTEAKKKDNDFVHPLSNAVTRRVYEKIVVRRADAREKLFQRELKKYLNGQRDRMIEKLQPAKSHVFRKKDLLDDVFTIDVEVQIGKDSFQPVLAQLLEEAGQDALNLVDSPHDFNMNADITSWIEQRSGVFMERITATTYEKLKTEFAFSLGEGESRKDLIKRIEATYVDITKARATTIARTEVHGATQFGTMKGYEQAGVTIKIWVTVGDGNVRHSHAAQDGQERPINSPFSNGLMLPGDPAGDAAEVINCRCSI